MLTDKERLELADDPFVSPVFAEPVLLEKFPPTLVISAGEDRLCEEDETFAMKLAQAGVEVTCRRFTDSMDFLKVLFFDSLVQTNAAILKAFRCRLRNETTISGSAEIQDHNTIPPSNLI